MLGAEFTAPSGGLLDLHVLVVEDSDADAELVLRRLRQNGYSPRCDRVATEAALLAALAKQTWDVALVDYNLPGFGGPAALRLLAEAAPDLPAITVSGAISEETAVATLTAGAIDYVLKDNLTRLAPAVRRAVDGAALRRRQRSDAERAGMTQFAIDHSSQTIAYLNQDGAILYANAAAGQLCEAPLDALVGSRIWDWLPTADEKQWAALWRQAVEQPPVQVETSIETATGAIRRVAVTLDHLGATDGAFVVAYARDITERKLAEEDRERSHALLANLARLVPGVVYQYRLYADGSSAFPYSSPGMSDIYEVTPEEVRDDATPVFGRLHPDDHDRVAADIMHSASTLETFYCEFRVVLPRQGLRWRWSQAHPERTEDGGTLWHGIISDVTERKLAEEEIHRQAEQLRRTVQGAVLAMSHVVETRDPYTAGHERRVSELAEAIGAELGLAGEELEALRLAALIHDIGKIAVPAEILAKPGRLSEVEFNLIRQHPDSGYDILEAIDFGRPVAEYVLQHHERLDGTGYPRGLAGDQILPEARIIAVADVVEAMSSHRPYRAALGLDAALEEVRTHAGVRYDADVVAACVRLFEERGFTLTP
jgi:PAS domain S-box-containing protein/putative nucleotidyltransferase with HDIG domain